MHRKALFILMLLLIMCMLPNATGAQTPVSELTGDYQVVFTTDQGIEYPLQVKLVDLNNGSAELSLEYKGYPINLTGSVSGKVEDEGAFCQFKVKKFGVVDGQIEFTVQKQTEEYRLQGKAAGTYSYLGKGGPFAGNISGSRPIPNTDQDGKKNTSQPEPTNPNPGSSNQWLLWAGAAAAAAVALLAWFNSRRHH
jgi:hypothetical protein